MDTVLVIEDSRAMQRTLQRLFEADSLGVQIASDGVEGLESFKKQTPSIVVLDLKLPKLSGKELCRAFKAHMPSVPIVVLSANAEIEDKVLLLELGADDYVTKPFSPRELLARVRRAMRRNGAKTRTVSRVASEEVDHELLFLNDVQIDFTEHGSHARRQAHCHDRPGVQAPALPGALAGKSDFARGVVERSLGLSQLSVHSHRGQPYPSLAPEAGTGSR